MGHLDEFAPEIAPEATDLHVETYSIGDLTDSRFEVGADADRVGVGVIGDPDGQFVAGSGGALRDLFERSEGAVGPVDAEEHFHAGISVPRGKTVVPGGEGLLSLGPEDLPMADDASPGADPDERDRRSTDEDGSRDAEEATNGDTADTDDTVRVDRPGTWNPSGTDGSRADGERSPNESPETSAGSNAEGPAGVRARAPDDNGGVDSDESENATEREDGDDPSRSDDSAERVPADVQRYERFTKIEGASYERANGFLRDRTHITAREWAIARLCTDFRTATGVEMTKIGENLPRLVPFMTDTYTPQAVNQARTSLEEKIRKAGATFLYGAMSDFFTAEELDDVMYEATEVAKFLLEVEGADLAVEAELAAEDRIQSAMREVHRQSAALRHDTVECPHCGGEFDPSHGDGETD